MLKSTPKSIISPTLEMPSPNIISNSAILKGGATLFFTILTLTLFPETSSESLI